MLAWLLIGPILIGVLCMIGWHLTGLAAFAVVAQAALAVASAVTVLAFVAAWRARTRRRPPAP